MYIAITLKRYRAVKEAGEIKMHAEYFRQLLKPASVRGESLGRLGLLASCCSYSAKSVESNYQFPSKAFFSLEDQAAGGNIFDDTAPSVYGTMALPTGFKSSVPFHGFEFQSSEACPKNFIIFNQTDYRSQIMYHPAMASKFPYPDLNYNSSLLPDDINALLSSEEEDDKYDDEEVSTARYRCKPLEAVPLNLTLTIVNPKRAGPLLSGSPLAVVLAIAVRETRKLKKMVKALKGILVQQDEYCHRS
ncbi:hypothetical protein HAX54_027222 [Datura stramonium]|uniref:Uncharacterized protein n=1 Tax=Datura stramonium TaxID=4076 RepID=A0ABS8S8I6_DATST|nr:hypothetical protein [Datura stramonium]